MVKKSVPALYTEMDLTDLMNLQAVDAKTHEAIGNDEYVELRDVSGGDVQVVQHKIQTSTDDNGKPVYFMVGAAPKNQDPKTHPQFFHALYTWGHQSSQGRGPHQSSLGSSQSWDHPRSSRQGGHSGGHRSRDSSKKYHCKNYNFHSCDDPECRRDHVCYTCVAYDHKAEDCPLQYDNYDCRY